jgi:NDP-sugar pyrophosphorylase family protein
MRAMVLAAGLGTRLRPLTDSRPKALVEIDGRSLLEIALARLRTFGIHEVILNVHHFADQVVEYLQAHQNFGMTLAVSREAVLLDTGGGLKQASHFFLQQSDEPFVVHNVDVLSSIDLAAMVAFHQEHRALATLAVQRRETSRSLLFNEDLQLCGRHSRGAEPEMFVQASQTQRMAFCGIHVISPRIFSLMHEEGIFPIVPTYLRLAAAGERIAGFPADDYYWRDLGTRGSIEQASPDLHSHPGLH